MSTCYAIVLRGLQIQDANAYTSDFSIGVPPITAYVGWMNALNHQIAQDDELAGQVVLSGVSVSVHDHTLHATKGYRPELLQKRKPILKNGKTAPFRFEAKIDLTVSIALRVDWDEDSYVDRTVLIDFIKSRAAQMRIAGGEVILNGDPMDTLAAVEYACDNVDERRLKAALMPGYVMVCAAEKLQQEAELNESGDPVKALFNLVSLHHDRVVTAEASDESVPAESKSKPKKKKVKRDPEWNTYRKTAGWLVPMNIGYQAISAVSENVDGVRIPNMPHQFVESVTSLVEFIMPHRVKALSHLFWHDEFDAEKQRYVCVNH